MLAWSLSCRADLSHIAQPPFLLHRSHPNMLECQGVWRFPAFFLVLPSGKASEWQGPRLPEVPGSRCLKCWHRFGKWWKEEIKRQNASVVNNSVASQSQNATGPRLNPVLWGRQRKNLQLLFYKWAAETDILWPEKDHSWEASGQGLNHNLCLLPPGYGGVCVLVLSLGKQCLSHCCAQRLLLSTERWA